MSDIKGTVLYVKNINNTLYYLTVRKIHDAETFYAGMKTKDNSTEIPLDIQSGAQTGRIAFKNLSLYIHVTYKDTDQEKVEQKSILYRYSFDTKDLHKLIDVRDFFLIENTAAVLMKSDNSYVMKYKKLSIPLTIKGSVIFESIKNKRLIFFSNGSETEIIDIIQKRNVYAYSNEKTYLKPDKFNVLVQCKDTHVGDGKMSSSLNFYRVYVDGIEYGRTNTAPGEVNKSYQTQIGEGYHYLRFERWILDRVKKKYRRANNILQPRQVKIFFPAKRVIKVKCLFNGRKYNIVTEIMVK